MPEYKYTAKDDAGKVYRGRLEAADEVKLQEAISAKSRYLVGYTEVKKRQARPLKPAALAEFSRQVGTLVGAGIPLVRALTIIADEEGLKPVMRNCYTEILRDVKRGTPLSDSMEARGRAFPPLLVNMFRSAEASGRLAATAMKMAEHYEKEEKLNSRVRSATVYPKFLGITIVLVVVILMAFVMPQFEGMFDQMEEMPVATEILFAISDFVSENIIVTLIAIAAITVALKIIFEQAPVKLRRDKLLIKMPVVGKLMKVIYTARFTRTLSSLYSCGISIVNSLQIARKVIGNTYIDMQFDELIREVRAGTPLSEALSRVNGFTNKLSSSVLVGEESGKLESILESMADNLDYESEMSLNRLVAYLEPIMLIVMALIVIFIMLAVILPIYDSYGAISPSTNIPSYD